MKIYEITDNYINYLKNDPKLTHVYVNKDEKHKGRKYLGIVISGICNGKFKFFIPFSSPKNKDFILIKGINKIRNDSPIIVRIRILNKKSHQYVLKGSLQIGTMIPCPDSELKEYRIKNETDVKYRNLVSTQIKFIKKNFSGICKKAEVIYKQKCKEKELKVKPKYLSHIIDFNYAILKCEQYKSV